MYTINLSTGIVLRDSDNKQVAPTQSTDDPDYVQYIQWIAAGNHPTEVSIPIVYEQKITKFAFRNRFTTSEKIALELASLDVPTADISQRQVAATLRVFLKDLDNASCVILTRDDIIQGVQMLVQLSILTADRANQILTNPIQPDEVAD